MNNKNKSLADKIPKRVWLLISFAVAMLFWYILSIIPSTSRAFQNVVVVCQSIKTMIDRGVLGTDILSSLISVVAGYVLGFVIALPVAILMAWYKPVRYIIEPWIQFIRNIPPLAYVPLIVIAAGVGRKPQIIVITIACFLTMCITIYQGVINVDETLIKAARVLGATAGLGMRIRSLNNSFESAPMLLYIIIIGILGISMEKLIKYLERRLTSWQEKREI